MKNEPIESTLEQFIKQHHLSISSVKTDRNPCMLDGVSMDHYEVKLETPEAEFDCYFSKGSGHHGAYPTLDEVLDCLASDASMVDNARNFEDFASGLGYDPDSRKAEKTYRACQKQAKALKEFLGDEAYEVLLYHTERL